MISLFVVIPENQAVKTDIWIGNEFLNFWNDSSLDGLFISREVNIFD